MSEPMAHGDRRSVESLHDTAEQPVMGPIAESGHLRGTGWLEAQAPNPTGARPAGRSARAALGRDPALGAPGTLAVAEEPSRRAPARPALRRLADLGLAAAGWVVIALAAAGAPVGLRLAFTLSFVAFGPGLALRRFLPAASRLEVIMTSLAGSLSFGVLVTLVLSLAHALTSLTALYALAAVASAAASADALLGAPAPIRTPGGEAAADEPRDG